MPVEHAAVLTFGLIGGSLFIWWVVYMFICIWEDDNDSRKR